MGYGVRLLGVLRESVRRQRKYPGVPRTKFDVLRLANLRNELRESRERLARFWRRVV